MKKLFSLIVILSVISVTVNSQILKKLSDKVKDKTNQKVDQKTDNAIDNTLDKADDATKTNGNSNTSNGQNSNNSNASTGANQSATPSMKSYQNYDFVPGDTVVFEDHFTDDQDGEFPAHWELEKGQAVVNKLSGTPAFYLTEGNYVQVYPRMKTKTYLSNPFTIEFDFYPTGGSYGLIVFLKYAKDGNDETANVQFETRGSVNTGYFEKDFSGTYPGGESDDFFNKWHHCAMAYKNNQLKCYVDQNRVLVVPSVGFVPEAFGFGGIGSQDNPIVITNIRAAKGGSMNMIGKKFTESKIVTHGINFDIDKATIKPESMGTLNMIVGVLKDNPDLKFEIDGHTDNSGTAAHNLTLSQQRADAVRDQLVKMGVDASRLTSKGLGDTKPISDNNTLEGKANNRRVEFVKM
jgi:outer membrane protein OmpA-like peptidoglycan-associated protein